MDRSSASARGRPERAAAGENHLLREKVEPRAWAFLARFAGLVVVGEWLYHGVLRTHPSFPEYLGALASMSARLLRVLGQEVAAEGIAVYGRRFSFTILTECDAVEPVLFFLAGVSAYPMAWRRRLLGAAIGGVALLAVNQLRIVSLYFAGVHWPSAFRVLHEGVWQTAMVLFAFAAWLLVVRRAPRFGAS